MRTDQSRLKIPLWAAILVIGIITESCSERSAPNRKKNSDQAARDGKIQTTQGEKERQPDEDQIVEDCLGFIRSTKVVPARTANNDCPGCPIEGTDLLTFRHEKTDAMICSGDTCTVVVTLRAVFNPGSGQTITGGLTAWIPPQQRTAYLSGQIPLGAQTYRVKIVYKRRAEGWRAVEFDRASSE